MKINRTVIRWALLSLLVMSLGAASFGQIAVGVSVRFGPPAIPIYAQPICPGPGYFWTPGYWAWNDDGGYYWVPGTWVVAPVGLLWTPGYWGWGGGFYAWHAGYWGPHIGFYGGVNYGFGYSGIGFAGGEWRGREFFYNRSVTNVSVTNVTNVYNRTVIVNENHVSYNGGTGGIQARPSAQEEAWGREQHTPALSAQAEHERMAVQNRQNFAAENHGRPAIAATARPADFSSRSVVAARNAGGEYHAPAMSPREARVNSAPGNRGNANEGFRPFTPPSKGAASNERNTNSSFRNENRNTENRNNENRNIENRNTENRNLNRNTENRNTENRNIENRNQNRNIENRNTENRNTQNRNNEIHNNQIRNNESRPTSQPRENSRPHVNAPKENSHQSAPAPKHQSAPPKEEHRGKGR
jgi:hypothetical protein